MTDGQIPSQWQLDDSGKTQDRWLLQETDQALPAHLQLQPETDAIGGWQPIDYQPPKARPQRGGWVVGILVILALIGVGAYLAWFYMNQLGAGIVQPPAETPAASTTGGEPSVVLIPPAAEPTSTPVAEPTATSTPEPTLTPTPALVEVREAVVNSQYGVNARSEPVGAAGVVRLLNSGERVLVIGGPITDAEGIEWWQVAIGAGLQGWAAGEFMTLQTRQAPVEEWVALLRSFGIEPTPTLVVETDAPGELPAPSEVISTPTELPGVVQPAPITVTAVISAAAGLNAREQPAADAPVLILLPNNTSLPVIGVSEDAAWLQVTLPDGRTGWVSRNFVSVTGDLDALQGGQQSVTPSTSAAGPLTPTLSLTTTVIPTTTGAISPTTVSTGTATVTYVTGVNARPAPSAEVAGLRLLVWNTQVTAIGRTADNAWVKVVLDDGNPAWVAAEAVSVTPDIGALPVTE